jgi:FtsZ-binding cell division protein ZapB
MGALSYDDWKTRSDRDDGPDDEFEPEPEEEDDDMAEPADITALVERLRGSIHCAAWEKHALVQKAADALEALQAEIEGWKERGDVAHEASRMAVLGHAEAVADAIAARNAALEEAAQMVDDDFADFAEVDDLIASSIATAIRTLKERNPT